MPSSTCGTGSPCCDSNRKKWQYLWIVLPRNRKYQSMTRIGPCSARSSSPVSSATSRRAASAGGSPTFRWPFGNPQLRDRKSTRLNSSHLVISYAVFCLKKKKKNQSDENMVQQQRNYSGRVPVRYSA